MLIPRYAARGDRTRTAPLLRYKNLYATLTCHKPRIVLLRARGRSRRGTLSKMASFIVDSCRDQRFSLEMWDWRRTIAWGRCTPLTIVDQFGINIRGFTLSCEALGRLLKKKKKKKNYDDENSKIAYERFLV